MSEKHVTYEIKIHRSLHLVLWVFALGLILNALPPSLLVSDASAELAGNPTIKLIIGEWNPMTRSIGNADLDD